MFHGCMLAKRTVEAGNNLLNGMPPGNRLCGFPNDTFLWPEIAGSD